MINRIPQEIKIDPSSIRQTFREINIKLFCCRYWILEEWTCFDLSVPFWRVYYNTIEGAEIIYNNRSIMLNKQNLIIIPPNTSFSTRLNTTNVRSNNESIAGRKFTEADTREQIAKTNKLDHLFIHFSLGFPLDYADAGIFCLEMTDQKLKLIEEIRHTCIQDKAFNFFDCLNVNILIGLCLMQLENFLTDFKIMDQRVFNAMAYVDNNYNKAITNNALAAMTNMASNSFARLFKKATGITIQQYIIKKRIENALNLIHHSDKNLDEIAHDCGFSDRFHFSKFFKKHVHMSPSYYRKNLTLF
ncbi:helix-turn-helix transcriptional regulator [Sphingobacterium phlebotomi]|uniref:Helix-turn-helix transcriptional regulator n=1 Tax=Sphingobacterium phlebotomi TaxID=2605433 RepID=A0A5D4H8D8_9SPHI|nr:AraC family transcriptional regulator [Sphingobacterium phlebotomi]TYR36948.1 helix-turn-helix transcriptional regulator [Sphingobacterium phlebotomi]